MSDDTKTDSSSIPSDPPQAFEHVRNLLDVIVKLIGAVAMAVVTWVGLNYQSRASLSSTINQREQAESQLRASMLGDLVEPIIGKNGAGSPDADLGRQLLLAEMVTLNFHDHFEFKPLLLEVDGKLLKAGNEVGHNKIASDARRVIDRQINMLTSIDGVSANGDNDGFRAKITRIDLKKDQPISREGCPIEGTITTWFDKDGGASICVTSPDNKACLLLNLFYPDYNSKTLMMRTTTYHNENDTERCKPINTYIIKNQDYIRQLDEAHLSIFDFPLTDNTKIMFGENEYRFSISLYSIGKPEEWISLKFVWFPQGYVTERERPINQAQFSKFLKSS